MGKNVLEITEQNFETEVIKSDIPVLVDFFAVWCGPCNMASPAIESIADKYVGKVKFCKLDIDKNPNKAQEYGVMSVPTFKLFKGGEEVGSETGFYSADAIERLAAQTV